MRCTYATPWKKQTSITTLYYWQRMNKADRTCSGLCRKQVFTNTINLVLTSVCCRNTTKVLYVCRLVWQARCRQHCKRVMKPKQNQLLPSTNLFLATTITSNIKRTLFLSSRYLTQSCATLRTSLALKLL